MNVKNETSELLKRLGVDEKAFTGGDLSVRTPVTGEEIGAVSSISAEETGAAVERAHQAFKAWRNVPAPRRGGSSRTGKPSRICRTRR